MRISRVDKITIALICFNVFAFMYLIIWAYRITNELHGLNYLILKPSDAKQVGKWIYSTQDN